jgi:hypothetical protein
MKDYEFILKFDLPDLNADPEQYVEALYEAGCDDAVIGIGKIGHISFSFIRESDTEENAISSAIAGVKKVIPRAILVSSIPSS